jgi:prolyl-tRNA synthetase
MVIRPYGFALWENMQRLLDARIKATGHVNAYFPLLIPESFFAAEAEHVEGFAPEVAWVTHGGKEKLEERLAIRPTSEAIIGRMFSKWIDSHRDLPVLINQWANGAGRGARLFLAPPGSCGRGTHCDATGPRPKPRPRCWGLQFLEGDLAIPVIQGVKTDSEKFAGAARTYCVEALMGDGRALQAGTSHNLGQNFAKAFNITFQDENRQRQHVWQTSWGVSTRLIGAIIMTHGDDSGLVFPPRVAPHQVVAVPIYKKPEEKAQVRAALDSIQAELTPVARLHVDDRDEHTPGWKYNEWEMRGVPLRLEIGPRDVAKQQVVLVRRDNRAKEFVPITRLRERVPELLAALQQAILDKAQRFRTENTHSVETYDEFKQVMESKRGFVLAGWDGPGHRGPHQGSQATIRCIPLEGESPRTRCVLSGRPARHRVVFAGRIADQPWIEGRSEPPPARPVRVASSWDARPGGVRRCGGSAPHLGQGRRQWTAGEPRPGRPAVECIENFSDVVQLDPRSLDAQLNLGYCQSQLGQWKDAAKTYERALALPASDSVRAEILNALAFAQGSADDQASALKTYEELIRVQPTDKSALVGYASMLRDQGRPVDAVMSCTSGRSSWIRTT